MSNENEQAGQPEPVQPPPAYQPPPQDTNAYIIWGFVLAAVGFFCCCCPPIFAIPAIILGAIAYSKGDQRGVWVIIAGIIALIGGGIMSWAVKPFERLPQIQHQFPGPWRRV